MNEVEAVEKVLVVAPWVAVGCLGVADFGLALALISQDPAHARIFFPMYRSLEMVGFFAAGIDLCLVALVSTWDWMTVSSNSESINRPERIASIALLALSFAANPIMKLLVK